MIRGSSFNKVVSGKQLSFIVRVLGGGLFIQHCHKLFLANQLLPYQYLLYLQD
jgi:hypothetical protein